MSIRTGISVCRAAALAGVVALAQGMAFGAPPRGGKLPMPSGTKPASPDRELAISFYKTGLDLFENGEFVEAAKQFERAFQKAPDESAFLYNIGSAYDKAGMRPAAITWYRKYVEAMPVARESGVARARVAVLEREQKELDAARATAATTASAHAAPPSLPFVEQVTHHTFQTVVSFDGRPYTLLGAGARKVMGFKVYAMGLYVEDEPARRAFPALAQQAGGSDHDTLMHGDLAAKFVVLGRFGKAALLHFTRSVKGKDIRDSYRDVMKDTFSASAPSDVKRDGEAFLALFDDVKEGDDVWIRTDAAGQISVQQQGKTRKLAAQSQRIEHDVWDIWLGDKPINGDLKRTVLDRIDTLGR